MKHIILIILLIISPLAVMTQVNYDEDLVPDFTLPEVLRSEDGSMISHSDEWLESRRMEILNLFENYVYGRVPDGEIRVEFNITVDDATALNGNSRMKNVVISLIGRSDTVKADLLIFTPSHADQPVPLFVGLNFYGNHTIHPNTAIPITPNWVGNNSDFSIEDNKATEASRGVRVKRWPVEKIIERGYGLATLYYGDIDPDYDDDFQNGIHRLLDYSSNNQSPNERSAISAWAFALSKALDYFESDPTIDHEKVAVIGHSRLGKTALWAGAVDQRFSLVISNNSGCGGAALSMRKFGETVEAINTRFPHWFSKDFHDFNGKEERLPLDQHMLIALMAPRPVYVASAEEDRWADPRGELLSLYFAGPVYKLFGFPVINQVTLPELNQPLWSGKMGYHIRSGRHDITDYDWEQYLNFADKQFSEQ